MLRVENKNLHFNRGDAITLNINCNNGNFETNTTFKFSIMEQGNTDNVLLQKTFMKEDISSNVVTFALTEEETRFGEKITSGYKIYWYELEMDYDSSPVTLLGYDIDGPKLVYLYPEAATKGGSI